jgi:hypothetical protein
MNKLKGFKEVLFKRKKIFIAGAVLVLFLAVLGGVCFFGILNYWTKPIFKIIPYPAAVVEGKNFITTGNFIDNAESIKKFYRENDFSEMGLRVDFETQDGKFRLKIKEKDVLNKMIENEIVKLAAKRRGIEVSKKEAEAVVKSKAQEAGSVDNLVGNLRDMYDWTLEDFRDNVVIPQLYLEGLMEHYKKEVAKDRDLKKINKAMDLLEEGNDFEEVTKEYSKGETAEEGGDLGWLKKEHLVPEVAEKAFEMKEGEYSDIIQSSLGNHIIYLEDTRGEGEEKEVKIKQIFTREGDFLGWFEDIKKEMDVKVFLNEYEWDKEKGELIFKDSNIEKKEEKIRMRSTGDPSVN